MHHIRHQMTKETGPILKEHIGDKYLHSEKWLEWILNLLKPLDSLDSTI